jgi:hypothetical protein
MARLTVRQRLAIMLMVGITTVSYAGESVQVLKTNPFARPVDSQKQVNASAQVDQLNQQPLVLRGTVVAGQQSLANISGVVVSLGEEIHGYKLVAIQQREAVLLKNGEHKVLSVDDKKEGGQR